jgi:hypothetical protein
MTRRDIERVAKAIKSLPHDGITRNELIDIIGDAVIGSRKNVAEAWAKWSKDCGYRFVNPEGR